MSTLTVRECLVALDDGGGPSATTDAVATPTPMIWGHGLTSSRAAEDEFSLVDPARIREDRRLIRYDARGHGSSGDLADPADGEWDRLALDQVALLDAIGLDEVIVGGASMGTATALHAAPLLGERLRALVLAIPPTAWETRAAQVEIYDSMADIVEERGVEPLIAASANMPPPDPFLDDAAEYRSRRATAMRRHDPIRLAAAYRGARGADLPSPRAIAAIEVPVLILAWSGDPGHPVGTAERLDELLPNATLTVASTSADLAGWTERVRAFLSGF